jgi:GntR family transcriptional regulator, transcriptional repressor for pyruvate dehydrogenase complex
MKKKIFKQKTVVEQVMEEIKNLIATGKFKVYDQIPPENDLAEMFGVSRPTIREAIKIFNYLGVLKSHTGRGTFVSDSENISIEALTWSILLGDNELNELIELRAVIEQRGLEILTRKYKRNPDSVKDKLNLLEAQIERMKKAVEVPLSEELTEADYTFHQITIEGSENSLFTAIYRTLKAFMTEEITRTHAALEDLGDVVKEHQLILDAIRTGNASKAKRAFEAHLNSKCFQVFNAKAPVTE